MKRFMKVVATTLCAGMVLSSGLFASNPVVYAADGVAINSTNFPDENFRAYVKENCDTNSDGVLSQSEIDATSEVDVEGKGIKSLKGIEHFTALTQLYCGYNQLTSLDVSKNTELFELICWDNKLTSLDVSKNTELLELSCSFNQLTSLDVSKNPMLGRLICSANPLTSLDVSKNPKLKYLYCSTNQLTSLDVSNNVYLYELLCSGNQLTSLDVSNNTNLKYLYCDDNQLTSIDVSKNICLTELWCSYNQLTSLDVSKNTELSELHCFATGLTSLDVSKNPNLKVLECDSNHLTSLDVSKNTELFELICWDNKLTSLDVSKNTVLRYLSCYDNQLTSLDVSKNTKLEELNCSYNQLTSLDVSKNPELELLYCDDNQLTSLDVSKNTELLRLSCSFNQLTSLDVSKNPNLKVLGCDSNHLTSLDVSNNVILYNLTQNTNMYITEDNEVFWYDEYELDEGVFTWFILDIDSQTTLTANGEVLYAPTTPTPTPTQSPTSTPTVVPTQTPTSTPTSAPTTQPTSAPTVEPTNAPTSAPTSVPTAGPIPTAAPTPEASKSVGSFVDRCYSVALGRDADEGGYNYWLDALNNGEICGAQAGYGFIFSGEYTNKETTNEEFVTDLYSMYFGRTPDEGGFNYWVGLLNSGASREEVFAGFANSTEFDNLCADYGVVTGAYLVGVPVAQQGGVNSFVARLYNICLNRRPDQAGQAGWAQKLIAGEVTGTTCAFGFVFSPEFIGKEPSNEEFVACMYRAFFGREADEAGFNAWVDVLNDGGSYEDVFNGFTGSAEFANLCAGYGINP